jgi:diacylglycerol kinase
MNMNLEPIGLPNVPPTTFQRHVGHAVVGVTFAVAVQAKFKTHPLISLAVGSLAAFVHNEADAPVSQVFAGVAARFA